MIIDRTGFILYTFKYQECVNFYKNILELKVLFAEETLTCFEFGNSYLMIEIDDESDPTVEYKERVRTCLRINVQDVKIQADKLESKGISVQYAEHDWGTIAKFYDPDGNLCAFKDSEKSEAQIEAYKIKFK